MISSLAIVNSHVLNAQCLLQAVPGERTEHLGEGVLLSNRGLDRRAYSGCGFLRCLATRLTDNLTDEILSTKFSNYSIFNHLQNMITYLMRN